MLADPQTTRDHLAALAPDDVPRLVELARVHGVEAWLAGCAPDRPAWHALAEQRRRFAAARMRTLADLHRFGAATDQLGAQWVVLKGQALAEQFYPRPHFRYGADLDVLIGAREFRAAVRALEDSGWRLLDRNWPLLADTLPGQLKLSAPSGGLLDLHWHLMNNPRLRQAHPLGTAQLLLRRRVLPSGLPVLHEHDQLIHLGLHGAQAGANRLLWLLDAGLAAERVSAWPELAATARRVGAGLALALVLLRARRWLGTAAPASAIRALGAGRGWRLVCWAVDRASPLRADPDRPALGRSVARSVGPTVAGSLVGVARHATAFVARRSSHSAHFAVLTDPADPASPLFDADDPEAREHYFRAVESS